MGRRPVPSANTALRVVAASPGKRVGKPAGGRAGKLSAAEAPAFPGLLPVDLGLLRRQFPARFSAFLRAHFRDRVHVAYFFGVDERTARNWWDGIGAPRGEVVLAVVARCPAAVAALWPEAA